MKVQEFVFVDYRAAGRFVAWFITTPHVQGKDEWGREYPWVHVEGCSVIVRYRYSQEGAVNEAYRDYNRFAGDMPDGC